ncbi:MAG TPA: ROK family protein, partial [Verrucomicrobiae bacterium]|nr:ROK family protein [Verrucomicrobiae bacterium]
MKSSSKSRYWLGFDLGGTKMMATVFDKDFNIVAYRRKKTKDAKGAKGVLARIVETVEEALQAAHLSHKRLTAIGIGSPGWLDLDRGVILWAPNLGLRNVPLKKELVKDFGCPVIVANDVDAGTYGEY